MAAIFRTYDVVGKQITVLPFQGTSPIGPIHLSWGLYYSQTQIKANVPFLAASVTSAAVGLHRNHGWPKPQSIVGDVLHISQATTSRALAHFFDAMLPHLPELVLISPEF